MEYLECASNQLGTCTPRTERSFSTLVSSLSEVKKSVNYSQIALTFTRSVCVYIHVHVQVPCTRVRYV